jgi:hypothetical protein
MQTFILYLMTLQTLPEILFCVQMITVVLKFLAALCGFALSVVLLAMRIRRWACGRRMRKSGRSAS